MTFISRLLTERRAIADTLVSPTTAAPGARRTWHLLGVVPVNYRYGYPRSALTAPAYPSRADSIQFASGFA
jgi:hypothetical protein